MLASEIRNSFISYFKKNGHAHIPSSSVIPHGDPTLLFTNAGMNQFKNVFLGNETRDYKRAVSSQKCIRAGGKHNDLDNVGFTARHHTFFEMLGNFSFGDYFKEDAVFFAWDFLHNTLGLPKDNLWVTVYKDDDQAEKIWKKISALPNGRIIRLGEKDNFWSMGDTGPCGPCSEILIDQGEALSCGNNCGIGKCDCDRYLELWNLVFMQFDRDNQGVMHNLPKPSIDTGMGLERITAFMQDVHSNFDTDLILPLIKETEKLTGKKHTNPSYRTAFNVIADHIRCLAFALSDGAYPSNEGRGYVLRKILRRGFRFGLKLDINEPFLYKLLPAVCSKMGDIYPELLKKQNDVQNIIKNEEQRFQETLTEGIKRIEETLKELKKSETNHLPGEQVFKLYDTYGIPLDIIEDVAREENLQIDKKTYDVLMKKQRDTARSAQKNVRKEDNLQIYEKLLVSVNSPIKFEGYEKSSLDTTILGIIENNEIVTAVTSESEIEIILRETPFYAESGGQAADTGILKNKSAQIEINYVFSPLPGLIVHKGKITKGKIELNDKIFAEIDRQRRNEIKKHHSATHLIQYALRHVLGEHVHQAGSLVEPDRLRFDFTHFSALTDDQTEQILFTVNDLIQQNLSRKTELKSITEAKREGAMALFGEKYGKKVRVVSFGDVSKELCGGTHVSATGEIGLLAIQHESSVATGVRRIEALCGKSAQQYIINRNKMIDELSSALKVPLNEMKDKIKKLFEEKKYLEKQLRQAAQKNTIDNLSKILDNTKIINGINVIVHNCGETNRQVLRTLADTIKNKMDSAVIALGGHDENKVFFLVMITKNLVKKGYHAGNIVKKIAQHAGGNGGGRPDMAQAGAKDINKIDEALNLIFNEL
ncbi:alanine--tRNA ligase [bacterium]|nr:alanine--tRNA ligase [bacterium]